MRKHIIMVVVPADLCTHPSAINGILMPFYIRRLNVVQISIEHFYDYIINSSLKNLDNALMMLQCEKENT